MTATGPYPGIASRTRGRYPLEMGRRRGKTGWFITIAAVAGSLASAPSCLEPFTGPVGTGGGTGSSTGTSSCNCSPGDHAAASCDSGSCVYSCADGFGDCDSDPTTCETDLTKDGNCGKCGVDCATECIAAGSLSKCNDPIEVTAGGDHTCALRGDGSVWCWGNNTYGECGTGSQMDAEKSPAHVALPFAVAHVVAKGYATCAWSTQGTMACWGNDGTHSSLPLVYTAQELQNVKKVSLRGDVLNLGSSLVLSELGGTVETVTISSTAQPSGMTALVGAVDIAAGADDHWCVLDNLGAVRCWGRNDFGQLGQGSTGPNVTTPQLINGFSATAIAAGGAHTCALTSTGGVACWGANESKEVGGGVNPVTSPQAITVPGAPTIERLATGMFDSGVIAGGELYLWGHNNYNQVSPSGVDEPTPTLYPGLPGVVDVALGDLHTCALLDTGVVRCWGNNSFYQLGDGTQSATNASVPPVDVKWP
jgi:alpha-tubulin suppressor-like RCC1 family protein